MDNFNKEAFIEEVEKRPVIWNTECPEYTDRILKKKAWNELTDLFADPNFSKEKKSILSMILQRKWKNLKDTYMKEHKKIRSNPSTSNQKGSSYMYYSKLSFLEKCLQTKPTPSIQISSSDSNAMEVDPSVKATELLASMNDSIAELMETASSLEKSTNRMKSNESQSSVAGVLSSAGAIKPSRTRHKVANPFHLEREQKSRNEIIIEHLVEPKKKSSSKRHEDDDKLFCLSLYKEIKKVHESNRLTVKIELLNVLQRAQMLPVNEIRTPYQYSTNPTPSWYGSLPQNFSKFVPPQVLQPMLSQPEPSVSPLTAFIRDLKSTPSTSSELNTTKFLSPFQAQSKNLNLNSPVSSLESSLSSTCSINCFTDT